MTQVSHRMNGDALIQGTPTSTAKDGHGGLFSKKERVVVPCHVKQKTKEGGGPSK